MKEGTALKSWRIAAILIAAGAIGMVAGASALALWPQDATAFSLHDDGPFALDSNLRGLKRGHYGIVWIAGRKLRFSEGFWNGKAWDKRTLALPDAAWTPFPHCSAHEVLR